MSNQNRFLLPHSASASNSNTGPASSSSSTNSTRQNSASGSSGQQQQMTDTLLEQRENLLSVDTDFDSYWEEEARNPHRNRIRIGRQYQAMVPPMLKTGEIDSRKLTDLETLSFCPKKSSRVSDTELDHYFTVAKSLNLFASLVETRSLLGRDVTIADLNHIRHKEGLSLASVIQPSRQTYNSQSNVLPVSYQQQSGCSSNNNPASSATNPASSATLLTNQQQSPQKSPSASCDKPLSASSISSSPRDLTSIESVTMNQPLMKALSHFISLHHPCHHDRDCKKLLKDIPLEEDSGPSVSITAGNLRQCTLSSSKESKTGRSRSSLKQTSSSFQANVVKEEVEKDSDQDPQVGGDAVQSPSYEDWTREEVELFSKAIEVCGKNFSSIKKEFLPSKSVKSIVEYYYIGSRDVSDNKKKSNQPVETSDECCNIEKAPANNNGQGGPGGGGGSSMTSGKGAPSSNIISGSSSSSATSSSRTSSNNNDPNKPNKTLSDSNEEVKQTSSNHDEAVDRVASSHKRAKYETQDSHNPKSNKSKTAIDARMSVYNFDEDFKDESPVRFECPRPGAEVKPLKAKPIIPNASIDSEATNSNVGSLKFFMDGQLVLKLNACQDQQEGIDKCHWVQSGDKVISNAKQKRYTKRTDKTESNQNGSQSNSVVSSYQDDDSKIDDFTGDEDSKESMNSFTNLPPQKNNQGSPNSKRLKIKNESTAQQSQLPSPINYNRLAVNNRIKERSDNLVQSPVINPSTMPWLQANSLAMVSALFGGLPFPSATGNIMDNSVQNNSTNNSVSMTSKPMDLSLEHSSPKPQPAKSSSRSRNRPKNS